MESIMDINFLRELQLFFDILETNPDDIVDDTAIERLLNLLVEECKQGKNFELVVLCIAFIRSDDVCKHPATLSFALRLAGALGYPSNLCDLMNASIIRLFENTHEHDMFAQPAVKYGFYKGLALLSNGSIWFLTLFNYLSYTMRSYNDFSHHLKMSAAQYLANFIKNVVQKKPPLIPSFTDHLITSNTNMHFVLESLFQLYKLSPEICLRFLREQNGANGLLLKGMKIIIQKTSTCKELLLIIINLLAVFTSSDVEFCWQWFLRSDTDWPEKLLEDLVDAVQDNPHYNEQFPMLCDGLIFTGENDKGFCDGWQSLILNKMVNHLYAQEKNTWKQSFTQTVIAMCSVCKKVSDVESCQAILDQWTTYCQKVLLISINAFDEVVDKNLYTAVNDKKITRLCFQYLQSIADTGKAREDTMLCLWKCLSTSSDSTQIICCTLDMLTQLIKNDTENFSTLLTTVEQQFGEKLSDFLALKMWDLCWEVKDSLVSLLIQLTECSERGSVVCQSFLEKNTFWVYSRQYLDDDESYVRARTVTFLAQLYSCKGLWSLYCEKLNSPQTSIWCILRDIFNKEGREDDMFTRRSGLEASISLIEKGYLFQFLDENKHDIEVDHSQYKDTFHLYFLPVLESGIKDFDWEVRRLTLKVWRSVITEYKKHDGNFSNLLCLLGECNFDIMSLCQATLDCELKVRRNALKCLIAIKEQSVNISQSKENQHDHKETESIVKIETLEDIETFLQVRNNPKLTKQDIKNEFLDFLLRCDLTYLIENLQESDVLVQSDPLSFIRDIISSTKRSEGNLLDCY